MFAPPHGRCQPHLVRSICSRLKQIFLALTPPALKAPCVSTALRWREQAKISVDCHCQMVATCVRGQKPMCSTAASTQLLSWQMSKKRRPAATRKYTVFHGMSSWSARGKFAVCEGSSGRCHRRRCATLARFGADLAGALLERVQIS